jgi:hypothetical protein
MDDRHPSLSVRHDCQKVITIWQSWLTDTHHHLSVWQSWLPDGDGCLSAVCQTPITICQSWLSDTHHHLAVMVSRQPSPSVSHGCQTPIIIRKPVSSRSWYVSRISFTSGRNNPGFRGAGQLLAPCLSSANKARSSYCAT